MSPITTGLYWMDYNGWLVLSVVSSLTALWSGDKFTIFDCLFVQDACKADFAGLADEKTTLDL